MDTMDVADAVDAMDVADATDAMEAVSATDGRHGRNGARRCHRELPWMPSKPRTADALDAADTVDARTPQTPRTQPRPCFRAWRLRSKKDAVARPPVFAPGSPPRVAQDALGEVGRAPAAGARDLRLPRRHRGGGRFCGRCARARRCAARPLAVAPASCFRIPSLQYVLLSTACCGG